MRIQSVSQQLEVGAPRLALRNESPNVIWSLSRDPRLIFSLISLKASGYNAVWESLGGWNFEMQATLMLTMFCIDLSAP